MTAAGRALSEQERFDWLRLSRAENVGPVTFFQLLAHFGSAGAALDALPGLSARGGLKRKIRVPDPSVIEREIARTDDLGARHVASTEADYPPLLRHIDDPPPVLTVKGDSGLAARPAIAIVGPRNASALGMKFARRTARELGEAGFTIVSGLARGIDAAAHDAALSTGTVAAIAGGIDITYPPQHEELQARIGEDGLLVSEMPPGTEPQARHFPRRNRIISGTAHAVLVVEAARRSGTLITARMAGEQGREVFAVPGSPLDPRAEGTNRLIREGAFLTTSARDIIDNLSPMLTPARPAAQMAIGPGDQYGLAKDGKSFSQEADCGGNREALPDTDLSPPDDARARLMSLLGPGPVEIDDLIRESGSGPGEVQMLLLELELAGRLERHGSQRVSLI